MTSSCRREHIDAFLAQGTARMSGRVLDIGGKKSNPRGQFRPPAGTRWEYLNLDSTTTPDHLMDAECMSLPDGTFDTFLLIEVLEHVRQPDRVLSEAFRILSVGGTGFITMPFLYAIHADPHDFQRWTPEKFMIELRRAGFGDIQVKPMGGGFSVMFDVLWTMNWRAKGALSRRLGSLCLLVLKPLAMMMDRLMPGSSLYLTTGWAVIVSKDASAGTWPQA